MRLTLVLGFAWAGSIISYAFLRSFFVSESGLFGLFGDTAGRVDVLSSISFIVGSVPGIACAVAYYLI